MSIFDWKHKKQRIELTAKENKEKMAQIARDAFNSERALKGLLMPDNFYICIGGLVKAAEGIFPVIVDTCEGNREITNDISKPLWDDFTREQEFCDEFFHGSEMRTYVIAKAWKNQYHFLKWGQLDALLDVGGINIERYREVGWWRVACFYYLAEKGFEDRDAFKSKWRAMTSEQCLGIVQSLSGDELLEYQLRG
jgi:hypothetical protein